MTNSEAITRDMGSPNSAGALINCLLCSQLCLGPQPHSRYHHRCRRDSTSCSVLSEPVTQSVASRRLTALRRAAGSKRARWIPPVRAVCPTERGGLQYARALGIAPSAGCSRGHGASLSCASEPWRNSSRGNDPPSRCRAAPREQRENPTWKFCLRCARAV